MAEEVLPVVPFRQIVFTIPRRLRKYFLFDRALYGELCRAAYASTRDFLRREALAGFPRRKKAVPAMVVAPQSFGDLLVTHPHCHAVVSLGLFSPEGVFCRMESVDFSGLEELFRERVFRMMVRKGKITEEIVEGMKLWPHSGFHLNWERRIEAEDRKELEGLLSYMERSPVSLRRLTYRLDGTVHYQGTKLHPRLGIDHQLVSPVEFLAMLVPHILLRYEVTIRSYGAASTTFRRKAGWITEPPVKGPPPQALSASQNLPDFERELTARGGLQPDSRRPSAVGFDPRNPSLSGEEDSEFARARRRSWAKLIARVWHEDPSLCSSCGEPMKIVAAICSPEQDDVIERILRHVQRWDPPWRRHRKVRGPPPQTAPPPGQLPPSTIDPIIADELYASDPIWDEASES